MYDSRINENMKMMQIEHVLEGKQKNHYDSAILRDLNVCQIHYPFSRKAEKN